MNNNRQREAAKQFASNWKGKGYEKGESQPFWLSLLRDVYGVEHPEQFIFFEEQVHLDHTSFIDGIIPSTKVLIEQKGLGKDLKKPIKQSDGLKLSPFEHMDNKNIWTIVVHRDKEKLKLVNSLVTAGIDRKRIRTIPSGEFFDLDDTAAAHRITELRYRF